MLSAATTLRIDPSDIDPVKPMKTADILASAGMEASDPSGRVAARLFAQTGESDEARITAPLGAPPTVWFAENLATSRYNRIGSGSQAPSQLQPVARAGSAAGPQRGTSATQAGPSAAKIIQYTSSVIFTSFQVGFLLVNTSQFRMLSRLSLLVCSLCVVACPFQLFGAIEYDYVCFILETLCLKVAQTTRLCAPMIAIRLLFEQGLLAGVTLMAIINIRRYETSADLILVTYLAFLPAAAYRPCVHSWCVCAMQGYADVAGVTQKLLYVLST